MALPIVRLGDPTSHGGKVVTASSTHILNGIAIARQGDSVACPLAGHGVNPIVEGSTIFLMDGRPVALHGHRTACGCILISTILTATHG